MSHTSHIRGTALAALVMIGGIHGVHAQANPGNALTTVAAAEPPIVAQPAASEALPALVAPGQAAQPAPLASTADEAKQSAAGNVAELRQLVDGSDLNQLRTSYNGSYGASLLFHGKEMTYYVALFQQKNFWRVIKTQNAARAEAIYADFVRQTMQLSDVELRRTQLEAQKAYTERLIALSQARANRLQADLNVAHEQQTLVVSRQKQTRDEAAALQAQKQAAQAQLREAQRQVRELQRQADAGLPRIR
jgi:hypothetical protein